MFKYSGKASSGYSVYQTDADGGRHVGFVQRTTDGNGWEAWRGGYSVTDKDNAPIVFRTRRDAATALLPIAAVEWLAREHWKNATSEDRKVSSGDSPVYLASKAAFLGGIAGAYPDMDAKEVYWDYIDHAETVIQCVNGIRRERVETALQAASDAAEDAAYYAAQAVTEDVFNATEDARLDAEADRIRAEWEAEVDAEQATAQATETPVDQDAKPKRMAAFLVTGKGDGAVVTYGIVAHSVPADKATGVTATGLPFVVSTLSYARLDAARRFIDIIRAELETAGFKVVVVDDAPTAEPYAGTIYMSSKPYGAVANASGRMLVLWAPDLPDSGLKTRDGYNMSVTVFRADDLAESTVATIRGNLQHSRPDLIMTVVD